MLKMEIFSIASSLVQRPIQDLTQIFFFLCHEKNIHAFATSTSLKKADQRTRMMLITQHQPQF
jgi:hypothetical protein